jgi:hypothetical protein
MAEHLIYDNDYLNIPLQDLPENGVIVCRDPQHRLGRDVTWAVLRTHYNVEDPPLAVGLFWDKPSAILFAEAL